MECCKDGNAPRSGKHGTNFLTSFSEGSLLRGVS
jgi:hypothetical protein